MTAHNSLTAKQVLDRAEAAIAAGDVRYGARLAYEAAMQAVNEAARRMGRKTGHTSEQIWDLMRALDGITLDHWPEPGADCPPLRHMGYYGVAESFLKHAETPLEVQLDDPEQYWQPDEYALFLGPVRALLEMLAEVRGEGVSQ